jgi:hypothetical protein
VINFRNQLQEKISPLQDGYKTEASWMTDHIERSNLQWKNKILIFSTLKKTFCVPGQLLFASLSMVDGLVTM